MNISSNRHPVTGKRLRTLIVGGTLAIASLLGSVAVANPASAATPKDRVQTATGAQLQSSGFCGGLNPSFTIYSAGFEYLQIGVVTSTGTTWGALTKVAQSAKFTYKLPTGHQFKSYVVIGYDWNGRAWLNPMVTTWFVQAPDLTYGTWFC